MDFKKRGRLEIINEVLKISKKGARKTRIVYGANMSSDQAKKYLSYAEGLGLLDVERNNGSVEYKTSERGEEFLEWYKKIDNLFNNKN